MSIVDNPKFLTMDEYKDGLRGVRARLTMNTIMVLVIIVGACRFFFLLELHFLVGS